MGFYDRYLFPRCLHLVMRGRKFAEQRRRIVPAAVGRVLEIGFGSGLNLPFYGPQVRMVVGLDPSAALLALAGRRLANTPFVIELVNRPAEEIPYEDGSFDTVLTTWTLCSIAEAPRALAEMRRVLKPGGKLLFLEHGRAPDPAVLRLQQRFTPIWQRVAGGCRLDRAIDDLVRGAGFRIERLETGYMIRGPRPWTWHYRGAARPG